MQDTTHAYIQRSYLESALYKLNRVMAQQHASMANLWFCAAMLIFLVVIWSMLQHAGLAEDLEMVEAAMEAGGLLSVLGIGVLWWRTKQTRKAETELRDVLRMGDGEYRVVRHLLPLGDDSYESMRREVAAFEKKVEGEAQVIAVGVSSDALVGVGACGVEVVGARCAY